MSDHLLLEIINLQREMLTELRLLRLGLFPDSENMSPAQVEAFAGHATPEALETAAPTEESYPQGLGRLLTAAEHAVLSQEVPEVRESVGAEAADASDRGLRFPSFGSGFRNDDEALESPKTAASFTRGVDRRLPRRGVSHPSEDVDELRGIFDTQEAPARSRSGQIDALPQSFGEAEQRGRASGARVTTTDLAGELGDLLAGLKKHNKDRGKAFDDRQSRFGKGR